MRPNPLISLALVGCAAAPAGADLIYNCFDMYGVGAFNPSGVMVFDDLHVVGGGNLTEVVLGLSYEGLSGGTADVHISLFLDDGNGVFGPEDAHLLDMSLLGESVGGMMNPNTLHYFDITSFGITVADGDLIWAGGQSTVDPNSKLHLQLPYPSVGTTDSHLYDDTGAQIPGSAGQALTFKVHAEAPAPCLADLNGDSMVDVLDLLALLSEWGATGGPADINGDGIVDVQDLLDLLATWGPCP